MKRILFLLLAVVLLVGVMTAGCAAIERWDIGKYISSGMAMAAEVDPDATTLEDSMMAVFYTIGDEIAVISFRGVSIIDNGDGYWQIYDPSHPATNRTASQGLLDYGIFKYKSLPDLSTGAYTMDALNLEAITWEDLPQSRHIGALKDVYVVDGSPRADVWRLYMGVAYVVPGCRVTQTAFDYYMAGYITLFDPAYDWLADENADCFVAVDFIHENFTGTDMVLPFVADKLIK